MTSSSAVMPGTLPAEWRFCAGGSAPNITAFHFRDSVALVSGQCGVPQWPGTTMLSRGILQQRGHVSAKTGNKVVSGANYLAAPATPDLPGDTTPALAKVPESNTK